MLPFEVKYNCHHCNFTGANPRPRPDDCWIDEPDKTRDVELICAYCGSHLKYVSRDYIRLLTVTVERRSP